MYFFIYPNNNSNNNFSLNYLSQTTVLILHSNYAIQNFQFKLKKFKLSQFESVCQTTLNSSFKI